MTLALPFCCAAVGFDRDDGFERDVDFDRDDRFELAAFDRAVGLDRAAGFDRDAAFVERPDALFVFGAEPFDDPLLDLLRGLLEAGLLFAILILFSVREHASQGPATRSEQG